MRAFPLAFCALVLAGCTANPATPVTKNDVVAPGANSDGPTAFHARGTLWLPTTSSMEPATTNITIQLNDTMPTLTAKLHLGTRVAGQDAPTSPANAMAKLVDASNKTVAQAMIMQPMTGSDATLRAENLSSGTYILVLQTHGGSDGTANGDHLDYSVDSA